MFSNIGSRDKRRGRPASTAKGSFEGLWTCGFSCTSTKELLPLAPGRNHYWQLASSLLYDFGFGILEPLGANESRYVLEFGVKAGSSLQYAHHERRGMNCFSLMSFSAWRLIFEPLSTGFRNDVVATWER